METESLEAERLRVALAQNRVLEIENGCLRKSLQQMMALPGFYKFLVRKKIISREKADILSKAATLDDLGGISVRTNNCLECARIHTVGELIFLTETGLLKIRGFGRYSLREVKRRLEDFGLRPSMSWPDVLEWEPS